jgi:hypothetical protein
MRPKKQHLLQAPFQVLKKTVEASAPAAKPAAPQAVPSQNYEPSMGFVKNFLKREKQKEREERAKYRKSDERKLDQTRKKEEAKQRAENAAQKQAENKNKVDTAGEANPELPKWSEEVSDHSANPEQNADYDFGPKETAETQNLPDWFNDYLAEDAENMRHDWKQGENEAWKTEGLDVTPGSILSAARASITHNVQAGGHGLNGRRPENKKNKSLGLCYRHVKFILKQSGCTSSVATGSQAKGAGGSLLSHGFKKLEGISSPYAAPQGSVIVYQCGKHGHIEWKGPDGFYSDFRSQRALPCSNFAVYFKDTPQCTGIPAGGA